jgi:hypothetical protein
MCLADMRIAARMRVPYADIRKNTSKSLLRVKGRPFQTVTRYPAEEQSGLANVGLFHVAYCAM